MGCGSSSAVTKGQISASPKTGEKNTEENKLATEENKFATEENSLATDENRLATDNIDDDGNSTNTDKEEGKSESDFTCRFVSLKLLPRYSLLSLHNIFCLFDWKCFYFVVAPGFPRDGSGGGENLSKLCVLSSPPRTPPPRRVDAPTWILDPLLGKFH